MPLRRFKILNVEFDCYFLGHYSQDVMVMRRSQSSANEKRLLLVKNWFQ